MCLRALVAFRAAGAHATLQGNMRRFDRLWLTLYDDGDDTPFDFEVAWIE